ncbi:MAG: hypothetical protein ACLT4C_04190 [Butyricicoccus sp.]
MITTTSLFRNACQLSDITAIGRGPRFQGYRTDGLSVLAPR